ncbi:MAG TPA: hypothetical protein VLM85_20620, partial [Polyangiaceae bacterium]|nr:hypothetical protein [Polyangiaceae bacterium]
MRAIELLPLVLALSCGGQSSGSKPPETVTPPPATATTVRVEDAGAPLAAAEAGASTPPPEEPLPPAKPTTIPLGAGDTSAEARELRAGDDAFEKGDWAGAEGHYQTAKRAAPTRVAARVGLARVRIAK